MSSFANNMTAASYPKYVQSGVSYTPYHVGTATGVSKDSILGESKDSGNSSGPHLHFEFIINSTYYDPFNYVLFPSYGYET